MEEREMAYCIVHHFPDGTKEQYEAALAAVHPSMRIPMKLATDSGDVGHPPERSDAGVFK
jgi:hypothetical protein